MSERQGESVNDIQLVCELKIHSEVAFRALFDKYYKPVYAYSLSLLKYKEYAEENVQEVFLKIWLNREELDSAKSFKAFLFTIARNQAFNFLNKAVNDAVLKEAIFHKSQVSCADCDYIVRDSDCKNLRKAAIKKLPAKRRQIFKMSRKDGKTYEEISQELGISINTVKSQISKALESIRQYLHANGEIL